MTASPLIIYLLQTRGYHAIYKVGDGQFEYGKRAHAHPHEAIAEANAKDWLLDTKDHLSAQALAIAPNGFVFEVLPEKANPQ